MSPIAHLSPESSRKDHYCETIEAFTPAAKTVTDAPFLAPVASESKINSPLVKQVMNLSPKASPLQVVDMVQLKSAEVAVAGSVVVQTPKLTNRNFIIAISLLTLLLIGPIFFFFTTSNSTIKDFKRVELKSARSYDLETAVIPAPKSADCANGISAAKKLQTEMSRQLNKGQNLFNFGMYDDIMEISDVEIPVSSRSGEDRQSFGPRVSGASAMTVFKRRTYQIFSDSIQSHTVNNFVKMLRELYRRIKELNLLKRFDHFIRGVVLSMVNSGQERIPAQI